jgi:hypothetical protein
VYGDTKIGVFGVMGIFNLSGKEPIFGDMVGFWLQL